MEPGAIVEQGEAFLSKGPVVHLSCFLENNRQEPDEHKLQSAKMIGHGATRSKGVHGRRASGGSPSREISRRGWENVKGDVDSVRLKSGMPLAMDLPQDLIKI